MEASERRPQSTGMPSLQRSGFHQPRRRGCQRADPLAPLTPLRRATAPAVQAIGSLGALPNSVPRALAALRAAAAHLRFSGDDVDRQAAGRRHLSIGYKSTK